MKAGTIRLARAAAVAAAVLFAVIYFVTALPRISYPYDLDFIEDSMLLEARQFALGLPVFGPPTADFVPQGYMPFYSWVGGWLLRVTGTEMAPLRLLSFAAVMVTTGLLFYIARRESGSNWMAVVCAGLFLAGYRLTGTWYELVRVDSLYITLSLAGMLVGIYSKGRTGRILVSALLLALAFWTKQTALLYGAGILFVLLIQDRRGAMWFAAAYLLFTVAPFALINWSSGGWLWVYTITVAGNNPVELGRVFAFFTRELFGVMAGLSLLALGAWVLAIRNAGDRKLQHLIGAHPWLFMLGLAVIVSAVGRASVGGNLNHLMSAYTLLCLAPALVLQELGRASLPAVVTPRRAELGLVALVLFQFFLGAYNPLRYLPTNEMRTAGDNLVARTARTNGNVFVMMHPYYAMRAGKHPSTQAQALWHYFARANKPLPPDLLQRFETGYYTTIISDETMFENEPALRSLLDKYYEKTETLSPTESPQTITGVTSRPVAVYERQKTGMGE